MSRVLAVCLALAGCDRVWGLERPDGGANLCPATYVDVEGAPYKYRFDERKVAWQIAADECRGETPDHITHLVVFDDTTDLLALQARFLAGMPPATYIHVGYARDVTAPPLERASFRSVIDTEIYQPLWNSTEPDNYMNRGESVVVLQTTAKLVDSAPRVPGQFLCSCDHVAAEKTFQVE